MKEYKIEINFDASDKTWYAYIHGKPVCWSKELSKVLDWFKERQERIEEVVKEF